MALPTKLKDLAFRIATGRVEQAELEGLEYADVRAAKVEAAMTVRAADVWQPLIPETKAKAGEPAAASRKITYVASSEHVDRMGDIIRVYPSGGHKGWLLDNIKANPVGLWCHESWMPPLATLKVWREKKVAFRDGSEGPALMSEFDYHTAEENPAAEIAYRLAIKRALRATSVGFKPLAYAEHPDRESRLAAGLGPYGVEFLEQDLHEVSICPVPANPYALELGVKSLIQAGEITDREAAIFAKVYPMTEAELVERVRERVRSVVDFGRAAPVADAPGHKAEDSVTAIDDAKAEADRAKRVGGAVPVHGIHSEEWDKLPEATRTEVQNWIRRFDGQRKKNGPPCVELTVRVKGTDAVRDAVRFLFASGAKDFRAALDGAADQGIVELAYQREPDPDGDQVRIPNGELVAANVPAETRKAVSAALSNAFEQLAAAQEAIGAVIDVLDDETMPADDVAAAAHAGAPTPAFDVDGARALAQSVRDLLTKINRVGGDGGPNGAKAGSDADVGNRSFDASEAEQLLVSLKTHVTAIAAR